MELGSPLSKIRLVIREGDFYYSRHRSNTVVMHFTSDEQEEADKIVESRLSEIKEEIEGKFREYRNWEINDNMAIKCLINDYSLIIAVRNASESLTYFSTSIMEATDRETYVL